ncbi:MAG TPA: protoporphyrinogen oxidase, partial [Bacteroidales bacterium]|nr:protoporphyrinogen oxidase [Bacteroidales bacterium]
MSEINADVLVVGAGLTGLTLAYKLHRAGIGVVLVDKDQHTGGVIRTISENGFTFEAGPNTGTLSNYELVELFESLGDKCLPVTGRKEANRRLILKGGRWRALPSGPVSAVTTPLFTLRDKFRILVEPFRATGTDPDESVADLVLRRMGKSFLDYAIDPFISGIYAGDPRKLITRYALPKLWKLEQDHGSFIRGSFAKARENRSERERKATKEVFSVQGGLQRLTDALASELNPERLFTGCTPAVVRPDQKGFMTVLSCAAGIKRGIRSQYVVITAGAHTVNEILPFISPDLLAPLTTLVYAKVA